MNLFGGREYRLVVADPPWPERLAQGKRRAGVTSGSTREYEQRGAPYELMSVDAIAALPVAWNVAAQAHLALWTLDRWLIDGSAARVARAWGFEPIGRVVVWAKANAGLGRPVRGAHEHLLLASRGELAFEQIGEPSVQTWRQVYENGAKVHSAKPQESFDFVRRLSPAGPRLEMFARRERDGWDAWGNQAPGAVELSPALG